MPLLNLLSTTTQDWMKSTVVKLIKVYSEKPTFFINVLKEVKENKNKNKNKIKINKIKNKK